MNTPQSNQYTPIQLENIKEAAIELLECLLGGPGRERVPAIEWLGTLVRACNRQPVYDALVKDSDGDFDSVNMMLRECQSIVESGELAIQKSLSNESSLPKEELSLTQTLRKIWDIKE